MNKNIGDMNESELKDFIIELNEYTGRLERELDKYMNIAEERTYLYDKLSIKTKYTINELQREKRQLKDRWNRLKSILIKQVEEWECVDDDLVSSQVNEDKTILIVMKGLERGDNND